MSVSLYARTLAMAALGAALAACSTPEPVRAPVVLAPLPEVVSLASFDCVDGLPALHRQICASDNLARLDKQLTEQYRSRVRDLDLPGALLLEANQRQWLLSRAEQCPLADDPNTQAAACLIGIYRQRADDLAQWPEARSASRQGANGLSAYAEFRLADNRDASLCEPMRAALNQDLQHNGLPEPARLPGATALAGTHGPASSVELAGQRVSVDLYDAGPYASYQLRARGLSRNGQRIMDDSTLPRWVAEQPNYGGRAHVSSSQTRDYGSIDIFRLGGRELVLVNETWGFYSPAARGESAYAGLYALNNQGLTPLCLYQSYLTPPRSNTVAGLPAFAALQTELTLLAGIPPPGVAQHERRDNAQSLKERQWTLLNMPLVGVLDMRAFGREGAIRQRQDDSLNRLFDWSERNLGNKQFYRRLLPMLQPAHRELLQLFSEQGLDPAQANTAADLLLHESLAQATEYLALPASAPQMPLAPHADYGPRYAIAPTPGDLERGRNFATLHSVLLNNAPLQVIADFIAYETETFGERRGLSVDGSPAVMAAVQNPQNLQLLLRSDFDASQGNVLGKTALMMAAQLNQADSARLLLNSGADVHSQTRVMPGTGVGGVERAEAIQPRQTALLIAAKQADAPVIGALRDAGALRQEWPGYAQQVCSALDSNSQLTSSVRDQLKAPLCATYSPAPIVALQQSVQLLERQPVTLFARHFEVTPKVLSVKMRQMAINVGMVAVRRAKVSITGPLTFAFSDLAGNSAQRLTFDLGFPVSSGAAVVINHKVIRTEQSLVLTTDFDLQRNDVAGTWKVLFDAAATQGLTPSNQGYVVIHDSERTEYQLVVRR
jgi:uncharacterized protein YecT (DUF1311 family)